MHAQYLASPGRWPPAGAHTAAAPSFMPALTPGAGAHAHPAQPARGRSACSLPRRVRRRASAPPMLRRAGGFRAPRSRRAGRRSRLVPEHTQPAEQRRPPAGDISTGPLPCRRSRSSTAQASRGMNGAIGLARGGHRAKLARRAYAPRPRRGRGAAPVRCTASGFDARTEVVDGLDVLHGQDVVRRLNEPRLLADVAAPAPARAQRRSSRPWLRLARVCRRSTRGTQQGLGHALKRLDAAALAAEGEVIHDAQAVQQSHGSACKALGARERPLHGQLEHQVRAAARRRPRRARISTTARARRAGRSRRTCSRLCPYPAPSVGARGLYVRPRGRCERGCTRRRCRD